MGCTSHFKTSIKTVYLTQNFVKNKRIKLFIKKSVISTNHLNGRFSVFGMFKACMNDMNSQEQDTCFSAQELPFVSRLISLVDKSVCPKAKRKFLELTPILSFITKNIFYKCLVLNMCVFFRKLLLMALNIYMYILCQKKAKKKPTKNQTTPPPKKKI